MRPKMPSVNYAPARRQLIDALRLAGAWERFRTWRRDHAWRYSPLHLYGRIWNCSFDRLHGVSTRSISDPSARTGRGAGYEGSPVVSFRRLLRRLPIDVADYTFVDFGSGKGRALLLAGELPFRQVIGVEFSAELHELATRNIAAYRKRAAQSVASCHCDAAEFALPAGNLVLYFFNPFSAEVLDRVIANISSALAHTPRKVVIIYLALRHPESLAVLPGAWKQQAWHRYRIYTCTPA